MQNIGSIVEQLVDPVATKITHHGTPVGFRVGLDGVSNITQVIAGSGCFNPQHKTFISDFDQTFGGQCLATLSSRAW